MNKAGIDVFLEPLCMLADDGNLSGSSALSKASEHREVHGFMKHNYTLACEDLRLSLAALANTKKCRERWLQI